RRIFRIERDGADRERGFIVENGCPCCAGIDRFPDAARLDGYVVMRPVVWVYSKANDAAGGNGWADVSEFQSVVSARAARFRCRRWRWQGHRRCRTRRADGGSRRWRGGRGRLSRRSLGGRAGEKNDKKANQCTKEAIWVHNEC